MTRFFALALLSALAPAAFAAEDAPRPAPLLLATPGLHMSIPAEDWRVDSERHENGDARTYYYLTSKQRGVILSVTFEHSFSCQTAAACLDAALGNPSYKGANKPARSEQGSFSVAQVDLDSVFGMPVKQTNLLAETIVNGVWADIHMSRAGKEMPDAAPMFEVLKTISVSGVAASAPAAGVLSLGTADLKVNVPSGDWDISMQRKPDDSQTYVHLWSKPRNINFSYYISRRIPCESAPACRDNVVIRGYEEAKDVVKSEQGKFSVVQFNLDRDPQTGKPLKSTHLAAEAIVGGKWLDIHISRADKEMPDAAPMLELLKTVSITEGTAREAKEK